MLSILVFILVCVLVFFVVGERDKRISADRLSVLLILNGGRNNGMAIARIVGREYTLIPFSSFLHTLEDEGVISSCDDPNTPPEVYKIRGGPRRLYWLTNIGKAEINSRLES